jgi:hypothetical protein
VEVLIGEHFYYAAHQKALSDQLQGAPVHTVAGARFCMGWEKATEVAQKARTFFGAPTS